MKLPTLVMTSSDHLKIHKYLFPGDGKEAAGIILCNQGKGKFTQRLIFSEFLSLSYELSDRREDYLSWPIEKYLSPEKITEIDQNNQSILTIHSHPNGGANFSKIDDQNDIELFASINSWFDDGRVNGSAIMLPYGSIIARTVNPDSKFQKFYSVSVIGDTIQFWKNMKYNSSNAYEKKIAQTLGNETLEILRSLKVGVVGCSGTGSIIVELLVRNCIGQLVLVDDDIIEEKNLNRILNSTLADAKNETTKVSAISKAIQRNGLETDVQVFPLKSSSPDVIAALIDCDVVFGCVDNASGRYHLDCISSAYFIPLFDVGVSIEADGKGGITSADAVAHYIKPEGSDLLTRGAYTMEQVNAEHWKSVDGEHYENQRIAGYLESVGEEQPAVLSVNMQAACLSFNDFLARLHTFRMDPNREYATQRYRFVHGCYEVESENGHANPIFKRNMGKGDQSLLVRNLINAETTA